MKNKATPCGVTFAHRRAKATRYAGEVMSNEAIDTESLKHKEAASLLPCRHKVHLPLKSGLRLRLRLMRFSIFNLDRQRGDDKRRFFWGEGRAGLGSKVLLSQFVKT